MSSRAYVIASDRGSVLVFNIGNQTSSAIALAGDAVPVQASLTPTEAGSTSPPPTARFTFWTPRTGGDILQISFPTDPTTFQAGLCNGVTFTCNPDLIAVKP